MSENDEIRITLTDENNNDYDVLLMDSFQYDNHIYSMFVPAEQAEDDEYDVIILEYKEDKGETLYLPVENEVLLDEIWSAYNAEDDDGDDEK